MSAGRPKIAHLTTVDLSLRYLLWAQLTAPLPAGIESIGISAPGPWVDQLRMAGIGHESLPTSTRGHNLVADMRAAADLWRLLRRVRPDVLHTHNPKPGIYGRIIGRLAGVPIVVNTVHGLYATEDDPFLKRALVYALEAAASRFSDAELVQSSEDLELMRRLRLAAPSKLHLLGNGVDLAHFDPARSDDSDRLSVRAELAVSADQILVGAVGRLVVEKGFPELFEAMRALDERFVLVCIGPEDPNKADAVPGEMIEAMKAGGVRFLGMRQDIARLYPAMDVFVLPSHREGFPRAAMEAAAMGLPIVATDIRGCREVVEEEVNGLLVPVRQPTALAAAIERMQDPGLRARMGAAGRRRAERLFDDRAVVRRVLGTYQELARRKGNLVLAEAIASAFRGETVIRRAGLADVSFLAHLHGEAISGGFLPRLGPSFMRLLYRALVTDAGAVVLVAEDDSGVVGFVAGVADTSAFYRRFIRRRGLLAGLVALPRLAGPGFLGRAIESLRYGAVGGDIEAELLAMGVVEQRRGQGIARRLGVELLARVDAPRVKVVVGADNEPAIAAYRRMGFEPHGTAQVHPGEVSEVLAWSR